MTNKSIADAAFEAYRAALGGPESKQWHDAPVDEVFKDGFVRGQQSQGCANNLAALRDELKTDINRKDGRWGVHGNSCVDDDYFLALNYVVARIDSLIASRVR